MIMIERDLEMRAWLAARYPAARVEQVVDGGYEATVWLLADGGRGLAVKALRPALVAAGRTLAREYGILRGLWGAGQAYVPRAELYVPEVEAIVMERVRPAPLQLARDGALLARLLRLLHTVPVAGLDGSRLDSAYYLARLARAAALPDAFASARLSRLLGRVRAHREALAADFAAVDGLWRGASAGLLHMDLNAENVVRDGQRLVLLDFGMAAFGPPVLELGRMAWQSGWPEDFVLAVTGRYVSMAGVALPPEALALARNVARWDMAVGTLLDCAAFGEDIVDEVGKTFILGRVEEATGGSMRPRA